MLPINKKISKFNHYNGNDIKYLVVHDTGNFRDTAANNANYFGADRGASAHYFADENSIFQVVEDYNGAWHCGDGKGKYGITNKNSLSIEMCNSGGYIAEQTINNTLELAKYLINKYNIPMDRVVRHYDASRKRCPNNMSANDWKLWHEFKNRLGGGTVTPTNPNTNTDDSYKDKIGYITGDNVNVRLDPNIDSEVLGQFNKGHEIKLYRLEGDWFHCYSQFSSNRMYIHKNYVSLTKPTSNKPSTNNWVSRLQEELNKQCNANLNVDGIAGPKTLSACITVREGARGNITRLIQERLIGLGYSVGSCGADGIFGRGTVQAVKNFQKISGLSADGIVGKNTWKAFLNL